MCLRYGWQACALWSFLLRAKVKPLHQNDYTTASAAARNGRNETPFNEDTNLRNATLPPHPKDTPPHAQLFSISNQGAAFGTSVNIYQHQSFQLNSTFLF